VSDDSKCAIKCAYLCALNFKIPGAAVHTILPGTEIPILTQPVIIDGSTQTGYTTKPLIELDGTSVVANVVGLAVLGGNSTVRGLAINFFKASGVLLQTGVASGVQPKHTARLRVQLAALDTARALAESLAVSPSTLNRVITGKNGISPDMALRLSKALGRSAESWLAIQDHYDLWQAEQRVKLEEVQQIEFAA